MEWCGLVLEWCGLVLVNIVSQQQLTTSSNLATTIHNISISPKITQQHLHITHFKNVNVQAIF